MDQKSCQTLGVKVVEGEYPGNTYYAAELHIGIAEANAAAEALNLSVRFVEQKS